MTFEPGQIITHWITGLKIKVIQDFPERIMGCYISDKGIEDKNVLTFNKEGFR